MALSVITGNTEDGNPPVGLTIGSSVGVGQVIIVFVTTDSGSGSNGLTITDNVNSGDYSLLAYHTPGDLAIWWLRTNAVGDPTITISGTAAYSTASCMAVTGFIGTPTIDNGLTAFNTGTSATVAINATTNFNNEIMLVTETVSTGNIEVNGTGTWLPSVAATYGTQRGYYVLETTSGTTNNFAGTITTSATWYALVSGLYDVPTGIIVQSSGLQPFGNTAGPVSYDTWSVSAGNTLIVLYTSTDGNDNGNGIKSISDGQGLYTPDSNYSAATHFEQGTFSLQNAASGSHTISIAMNASAAAYGTFVVVELQGSWVFDALLASAGSSGTSPSISAGTTPNGNDFQACIYLGTNANDEPANTPTGWNSTGMGLISHIPSCGYVWQQNTAAVGATWGTLGTSDTWGIIIVGYVPQAVALNQFEQVANVTDGFNANTQIWWCPALTTASGTYTLTANIGGAVNKGLSIFAAEVSGLIAGISYSGSDQAAVKSGSAASTATITNPGVDVGTKDFACAGINIGFGSTALLDPPTGGAGWTSGGTVSTGFDFAYRVNAAAVTDAATWTWTTNNAYAAAIAAFKSTAGAALVNAAHAHANALTVSVNLPTPTVGNAVIVICGIYGGSAAGLNFYSVADNQGISVGYTISASGATFAFTGEPATFSVTVATSTTILCGPGAFDFQGAQSQSQFVTSYNTGAFALTGEPATFVWNTGETVLAPATGSFALTGQAAILSAGLYTLNLNTGTFSLTGQNANLVFTGVQAGYEILPNFVGMDWLSASAVLWYGGFAELTPQIVKGSAQQMIEGLVIGQTPGAFAQVPIGCAVQLSVATSKILSVSFENVSGTSI